VPGEGDPQQQPHDLAVLGHRAGGLVAAHEVS
jgi:hypothetical protein